MKTIKVFELGSAFDLPEVTRIMGANPTLRAFVLVYQCDDGTTMRQTFKHETYIEEEDDNEDDTSGWEND